MALILSLETATDNCSVALHDKGQLIASASHLESGAHSRMLPLLMDQVMNQAGASFHELKAVAVSEGPGSYTGLRIGTSTAKGLAFSLDIKLLAIDTLKGLAHLARSQKPGVTIIAMLDARRMEVYREVFDSEGKQIAGIDSEILETDSFQEYLKEGQVCFVGNANEKASQVINSPNAYFLDSLPNASSIGELAWENYQNEQFESVSYFTPNYLKEFRVLKSKKNPFT
jgi:tRNA threonylcarbamoyladenosine biosynthesis protein TsaB